MIDWVTARLPFWHFSPEQLDNLALLGDRIRRWNPRTGEVSFECQAWDSIRSDSHALSYRVTGEALFVQGSPARVIGDGDAVFSSGASANHDLVGCVDRMVRFLAIALRQESGSDLVPDVPINSWLISRVDVTQNLLFDSDVQVSTALSILRGTEGGRYRISAKHGDTAYWSS
ncbi:MAG: hypothetical protein HQL31_08285, partial [Planctomycetes bacterium]|nr:hypothetical protein [Planctomycetota bacterium]